MRARKIHCKRGHELTGKNIYVCQKTGSRTCRLCRNTRTAFWNERRTPEAIEKIRIRKLWAQYKLTEEKYQEMSIEQNGLCYLCRKSEIGGRRLSVDHDHVTGEVRKLLCRQCNTALGGFNDNVEFLLCAVQYLKEHAHVIDERNGAILN